MQEQTSETLDKLLRENDSIAVWWSTWAECSVAISRLLREGLLNEQGEDEARASLVQLAAAFVWRERSDEHRVFVCLDDRLRQAARDEGFDVLPEALEPG